MALFNIFANLFSVWFNRRQLDSHTCLAFHQLRHVVLDGVYEENLALCRYVIAFSENHGYSLILRQGSKRGSFLKVSCNVESETISVNFLCSVTLKSPALY